MSKPPAMIYLVSCVATKRDTASQAQDLYLVDWFAKARALAETGSQWLIVSAKHGLLRPEQMVSPYELKLQSLKTKELEAWGARIRRTLTAIVEKNDVTLLASKYYCDALIGNAYQRQGDYYLGNWPWIARVHTPLAGLGIGSQKRWMMDEAARRKAWEVCAKC